jgi:hypothetical protein
MNLTRHHETLINALALAWLLALFVIVPVLGSWLLASLFVWPEAGQ